MSCREVVVIGAGPAGCAAAVQCSRLGLDCAVLDVSGVAGGLIREARLVENYPGLLEPLTGKVFAERLSLFLSRNSLKVRNFNAGRIRLQEEVLLVEGSGGKLQARAVIVATGTAPVGFRPKRGGSSLIRRSITGIDRKNTTDAAVVGGGESALDYALNLADSGSRVKVLVRGSELRARGRLIEMADESDSVEIMYNTTLIAAEEMKGRILLRCLSKGKPIELETDAVLASVGRKPSLPELPEGLVHRGGEVSTSIPGLYIAGDAAMGSLGQAVAAAGQGITAAKMAQEHLMKRGVLY
ncbi:MAG: NAD(P)-binding protein [Candidatus Aegiribacteria sp.]|nr:NAD(P)-binding protein [Candidatus Aegiribacteria sp.]MBD3294442.1 NAD(P)-binding protein [Candidatus Fermentibacteria bacterium]